MPGSSRLCRRRASWRFFTTHSQRLPGGARSQLSTALSSAGPHRLWMTAAPTNGRCSLTSMGIHSPQAGAPAAAGNRHVPFCRPLPHPFAAGLLCSCLRRRPGTARRCGDDPDHHRVSGTRADPGRSVRHSRRPACDAPEAGDPAQLLPRPAVAGARGDDLRPARAGPAVRRQCDLHRQRYLAAPPRQLPGLHPAVRDACAGGGHPCARAGSGAGSVLVPGQDAGVVYSVGHVNAGVDVGGRFGTVDLDRNVLYDRRGPVPVSRARALAHFYNNRGAERLADGDFGGARAFFDASWARTAGSLRCGTTSAYSPTAKATPRRRGRRWTDRCSWTAAGCRTDQCLCAVPQPGLDRTGAVASAG